MRRLVTVAAVCALGVIVLIGLFVRRGPPRQEWPDYDDTHPW